MTLHLVTNDTRGDDDGDVETIHVIDLTDEELLGLDGPTSDQVAPLPWAGGRPDADLALVAEVGLRSLVNHGRALAGEEGIRLPQDLAPLLDLRTGARAIVYADHSTPDTQETRILYVHPHAVLTETVNAAGVHRFVVGRLDDALEDLAHWCVPATTSSADRALDGDDLPPELLGLRSAVLLDVVTLADDGTPHGTRVDPEETPGVRTDSLTLYRLADGAVVEGVENPANLDLVPRSPAEVRHRVIQTVRGSG